MRPVTICGGGLAGLSLGILLRQNNVPVTIFEADHYPRHKVCGEFISGRGASLLHTLGIEKSLETATLNRSTGWFFQSQMLFETELPAPAIGISRHSLDTALANRFSNLGGILLTGKRYRSFPPAPGHLLATGRRIHDPKWIGLKLHCRGLPQKHDLTMYLSRSGYVGISRIENNSWNVCGLFKLQRDISPGKSGILPAYLKAAGLSLLAENIASAETDPASVSAIARPGFGISPPPENLICIGDSAAAIPPFAGNGISIALESAELVLPELLAFSSGISDWENTCRNSARNLRKRFHRRITAGKILHPFLLKPAFIKTSAFMLRNHLPPFHLLLGMLR